MKGASKRYLNFNAHQDLFPPKPQEGKSYLLYIHIPFCEELCPYCSFNRIPFQDSLAVSYYSNLQREIEIYRDLGYNFNSVYVGGGTPTILSRAMADILLCIREKWPIQQISLETNPNHLTPEVLQVIKEAGVNRLSVGVQTFDDGLLKTMERLHKYGSGEEIKKRLSSIMGTFDTLNIDMIFNFPSQTLAMLTRDLEIIQEIEADQVTFYPLMVSTATRKVLSERFGTISYRQEKRLYREIIKRLNGAYSPGSAWCFSRKKGMIDEYIVDHDEYAGLGSGSFGYIDGTIYSNTFSISQYVEMIGEGRLPIVAKREFTVKERIRYDFLMRLFGISMDVEELRIKYGSNPLRRLWKELSFFRAAGAIEYQDASIRLTPKGQYYWVILMREFFTGVNNFREQAGIWSSEQIKGMAPSP
jgi:coproporphyrinogen III oxidase-like Fe-S oxidoreductase